MKKLLLLALCLMLGSCAAPNVLHYQNLQPKFDLEKYFLGSTDAWGMFQKRSGEVVKRFHVEITGSKQGEQLLLDERFSYDDGTRQQRVWTLTRQSDGSWHGTAPDVVGVAIGEVSGNALHWQYNLLLPGDDSTWEMHFDDWMFMMNDTVMINRASMQKWGMEAGQVTLFFTKRCQSC